jgi:hypothetical protein
LYGICFGLPLALKLLVNILGNKKSEIPFLHGVGIYCYSFSSFMISSLLCGAIPVEWVQWVLITYSAMTSIMFLIATYWADLSTSLDARKRLLIILGICITQLGLLLIFKLYFFKEIANK